MIHLPNNAYWYRMPNGSAAGSKFRYRIPREGESIGQSGPVRVIMANGVRVAEETPRECLMVRAVGAENR
jgi:hypothetical protein